MTKFAAILGLLLTASVSNAHPITSMQALDALKTCAAEVVGLSKDQIDESKVTGEYLGSTPSLYGNYCKPLLDQKGATAPFDPSLLDWVNTLDQMSLAAFAIEVAKFSK
jgi:hypothetical protein